MDFRDTPDSAQFVCTDMSPTHVAAHPIAQFWVDPAKGPYALVHDHICNQNGIPTFRSICRMKTSYTSKKLTNVNTKAKPKTFYA